MHRLLLIILPVLVAFGCSSSGYKKEANIITERHPYALVFRAPYGAKNTFNIILPSGERRRITFNGYQIIKDELR
ncbi:hypothetical protein [Geminisphaera colitermitum]|uniref:hypothetical protein n=1 Tax=Geminisphaera colitermitum TaxID=1148786 RepID=UPI0001965163|nr:hypothetical protein [Geminisphaera colitermitum]